MFPVSPEQVTYPCNKLKITFMKICYINVNPVFFCEKEEKGERKKQEGGRKVIMSCPCFDSDLFLHFLFVTFNGVIRLVKKNA